MAEASFYCILIATQIGIQTETEGRTDSAPWRENEPSFLIDRCASALTVERSLKQEAVQPHLGLFDYRKTN